MAVTSPIKEDPVGLFRELLIAISQSEPEKVVPLKEHCNGLNDTKVKNEDRFEASRLELISISCAQSGDNISLPSMGMQ